MQSRSATSRQRVPPVDYDGPPLPPGPSGIHTGHHGGSSVQGRQRMYDQHHGHQRRQSTASLYHHRMSYGEFPTSVPRPPSPPTSETTESSCDKERQPIFRSRSKYAMHHHGTLRSSRSVPTLAVATWDGEPCPLHGETWGLHGGGSVTSVPLSRFASTLNINALSGPTLLRPPTRSIVVPPTPFPLPPPPGHFLPPPPQHHHPHLGPPLPTFMPMRMRYNLADLHRGALFPLGPRSLFGPLGPFGPPFPFEYKAAQELFDDESDEPVCRGQLIVVWLIVIIITTGIILGIVLSLTVA
ncbi:uncharacterized protein LOC111269100 [Varroa jacobsoni]|uniref:uncharacterized protein LOC111269100 n=1 Tax=Varroa jacobsoni TaxID=62625 RepID=UPI000BF75923|nr:uncharacterized protein LOC111269100 [Varroa jacobsoni]